MREQADSKSDPQKALTSIRDTYTLSDTQEGSADELDTIMIKRFLNTLSEVAIAVASRKTAKEEVKG